MRIYNELPDGTTIMSLSHDEIVKSGKRRERDAVLQRIFGNNY